jgi:hypothetical protein
LYFAWLSGETAAIFSRLRMGLALSLPSKQ